MPFDVTFGYFDNRMKIISTCHASVKTLENYV